MTQSDRVADREAIAQRLEAVAKAYDEAFEMARDDEHAVKTAAVATAKELRKQAAIIRGAP